VKATEHGGDLRPHRFETLKGQRVDQALQELLGLGGLSIPAQSRHFFEYSVWLNIRRGLRHRRIG
jgi:hypothetical protein